ncbi:hypothetical protein [Arenimonas sp. GDDSR-1]|uniref:hypothetical protein n=1 Tax=Arenimonas sp. GDDSR-1 TaxID=2950125 RepID=UPI00260B3AB6|nr:hypothetical protein [Arenimonas sp. GDDSR-1]
MRIVLVNPEAYSVHIAEYDPVACKKTGDVGWLSGGRKIDAVRIDMPGSEMPREGLLERRIPADRRFAIGAGFIMPKQSISTSLMGAISPGGASAKALTDSQSAFCEAPVFIPLAGQFYELHLHPQPQRCESTLYRLETLTDGNLKRIPVMAERIRFPLAPGKPVCPESGP